MMRDGITEWNPYCKFQMSLPEAFATDPSSVMMITFKETFSWFQKLLPVYGKNVAVIGSGSVGMFFMKLASVYNAARVTCIARSDAGRKRAKLAGADEFIATEDAGIPDAQFDLVIDAAGISTHLSEFLPLVTPGGVMAVYGLDHSLGITIDAFGSGVTFAFHNPDESDRQVHQACVALVTKGIITLSDFHSSVMDFSDIVEGFQLLRSKEEFKTVFRF